MGTISGLPGQMGGSHAPSHHICPPKNIGKTQPAIEHIPNCPGKVENTVHQDIGDYDLAP